MFLVPLNFVRIFRGAFPSLRTRVRRVSHHKSCFRQDREPHFTIRIPKKSQKTHTLFRNRHAGVEFLRERKRQPEQCDQKLKSRTTQNVPCARRDSEIDSKMLACDWLPAHTWKLRNHLVTRVLVAKPVPN